jgi:hypothetical protein
MSYIVYYHIESITKKMQSGERVAVASFSVLNKSWDAQEDITK